MAEKDKIVEAQAEPKKKPAGARKERKSPRAIYEEIFVNAAKAENELEKCQSYRGTGFAVGFVAGISAKSRGHNQAAFIILAAVGRLP